MHGQINYLSRFHPEIGPANYPIRKLMGKKSEGVWGPECTEALNKIADIISQKLPMKVPISG